MRTLVRGLTYTALLLAVVLVPHAIAYALIPDNAHNGIANAFPICATEDSTNCVWNAGIQGNGQGNSFIDIDETAYYFSN